MAMQTWTDPAYGVTLKPVHIDELQDAINAWESAYSITLTAFTDEEPTTATQIDALLFTEMQDALDDLKTLIGEGTFTFTTAAGYKFGDQAGVDGGDPLIEEIRDAMNYLQDGKCYQCHTCDTEGCTCESACYSFSCTCDQTCDGHACDCDASCDGHSGCTCDQTCDGYSACSCNSTCYGYSACSCDSACFGYSGKSSVCSCNNRCHGYSACSCNNTCYGYSACSCDQTCDGYVACTCDFTCDEEGACSCDSTCHEFSCSCDSTCYEDTCTKCHDTAYEYPWT